MKRIAVIGGGPAGMLAAAEAAGKGNQVILFEQNEKTGKKLYITGKGRCNLTNACPVEEMFEHIPRNPKFLYSALYGFTNRDIMALVESMGIKLKVERGQRVFPVSDHASDVLKALNAYMQGKGVEVRLHSRVESLKKVQAGFIVTVNGQDLPFETVILCTGGKSYPTTGSDGSGYALAQSLGHTLVPCKPSLVPLETQEDWPKTAMGLSLRNVRLQVKQRGKTVFSELGEMMFTHFGVSGPLVLSASSRIADAPQGCLLSIDLKPGLDPEALDRRVQRDFEKNNRRQFSNGLGELLPAKLIPVLVELSGIPGDLNISSVTRVQRQQFCHLVKNLPLTVKGPRDIQEAVITRGGIPVKEVDPSTMESKLVKGLYFAGEMLDVDAYTGGFNLQIAYSTGVLAGRSAGAGERG